MSLPFKSPVLPKSWSCCETVPVMSSSFPGSTQTTQTTTWPGPWTLRYLDILNSKMFATMWTLCFNY